MNARFFIEQLEAAIAHTDVRSSVMFSQDDGKVHLWGSGWEFVITPGKLPVAIEAFGSPPVDENFRRYAGSLLEQWAMYEGVFTPRDQERLQRYRDHLGKD